MESAWPGRESGDGIWSPPVDIEVHNSEVRISGDIKERERKGILRRRARPVGRFEFRVVLPGETDADNVDASMKHGVLTLRIPKPERSQPHRIEVKDGS
jgi:HSP20 family protein